MRNHERYDHAIVIGGSIAGLLAARVLADSFSQVTLIERDALPTGAQARKGAPQARHAHNIMLRGREIIEAYCPGITQELCHQGAMLVDTSADMQWLTRVGWIPRFASGIETLACSRDLLESQIRHRVTAHPHIQIVQKTDVLCLLLNSAGERVTGVEIRQRGPDTEGVTQTMHADLVVDASGRNSRAPQWLAALGYPTPPELTVDAQMWYASMIYAIPPGPQEAKSIFIQAKAPETARMAILLPIEGNRWLVSVNGTATDERPTDTASFLAFLKTLRSPLLYERLKNATPLSPVAGNGNTANRLRQYERIRMPEQFMVMGDALCAFNPVYGQGMTVAALESQALANCLTTQRGREPAGSLQGLTTRFQQAAAALVANPWMLATSEDYRIVGTIGAAPGPAVKFMQWYLHKLLEACAKDQAAHAQLLRVIHMVDGPGTLFQPSILWKIARAGLRLYGNGTQPAHPSVHGVNPAPTVS